MPETDTAPFISLGDAAARVVESVRPARSGVETWPVTDRASWLARRTKDVTASAAGALLGAHTYLTPYSLWCLKSGHIAEDPEETPAMVRGRLLEPVAIALLREMYPAWTITTPHAYWRDPAVRLGCTPDALAQDPLRKGFGVLQIKSVEPSIFRRKWRTEDGAVEPPIWIAVQALIEAHLTGASWAAVAVLRVGFGLDIDVIDIPLHAGLLTRIEAEVAAFWRGVESGQPPAADYSRDGDVIAALYPPEQDLPPIDLSADNRLPDIIAEREELMARARVDEARKKEIDAEITDKLAGHSVGVLADGTKILRTMQTRNYKARDACTVSFPQIRIKRNAAA